MKIKYSKKIDKKMFIEVNKMRSKLSPVFGFNFPKVKFDRRLIPIAKVMTKVGKTFLNEKKLKKVIKEIYKKDLPELIIYINTTPFSSWNVKGKYLLLSYTRNNCNKFFSTVCHESNHFMYDLTFGTKKYQDTKIKETLTVLNNIFGVEDKGWRNFLKARMKVLDFYKKEKNLEKTIKYAKNILS
jgi:hypothetical protein